MLHMFGTYIGTWNIDRSTPILFKLIILLNDAFSPFKMGHYLKGIKHGKLVYFNSRMISNSSILIEKVDNFRENGHFRRKNFIFRIEEPHFWCEIPQKYFKIPFFSQNLSSIRIKTHIWIILYKIHFKTLLYFNTLEVWKT